MRTQKKVSLPTVQLSVGTALGFCLTSLAMFSAPEGTSSFASAAYAQAGIRQMLVQAAPAPEPAAAKPAAAPTAAKPAAAPTAAKPSAAPTAAKPAAAPTAAKPSAAPAPAAGGPGLVDEDDEDELEETENSATSTPPANPWDSKLEPNAGAPHSAPSPSHTASAAGTESTSSAAGALEPSFSLGLRLLGFSRDEETFEAQKVTLNKTSFGLAVGYALNPRHTIVAYTDFAYNSYDGSGLDNELDYDIGLGTRGELWKAEGVFKPFLEMGLSVRNKNSLESARSDILAPSQNSLFAVSMDFNVGVRFWFAGSNKVFFDFIAGLLRTDLYSEKTKKSIVTRKVDGETVTIAIEDVDRGFALIDRSSIELFSSAALAVGYSF